MDKIFSISRILSTGFYSQRKKVLILLMLALAACNKIERSIKRDIIISSSPTGFTIPAIPNTASGNIAGQFPSSIDLEKEISDQASDFNTENITLVRLNSAKITLDVDSLEDGNNFGNFESIRIEVSSGNLLDTLASLTSISTSKSGVVSLPAHPAPHLKEIVTSNDFIYKVIVKLRKPTTVPLKANLETAFTLSMKIGD